MSAEYGRDAVLKYGATTVGYAKGWRIAGDGDIVKDWSQESVAPALVEYGNQSYIFSVDKMYVDNEYVELLLNQTKFTLQGQPEGTEAGAAKAALMKGCVVGGWELTMTIDGAVLEAVSGEGISLRFTTVA